MELFACITEFIKSLYPGENPVPLHAPRFSGNEKKYLMDCINTTYVSYVGQYVNQFENEIRKYTRAKFAIAVSSGTAALHMALLLAKTTVGDEVITQPLSFVATANAIAHCGAIPVFVDVERSTLGLDPEKLESFLTTNAIIKSDDKCYNKFSGKRIAACIPMHTFGHPLRIDEIVEICSKYNIVVVEDAAEALGSFYKGQHAGTFGELGILSFNGNKPVTSGSGGMIITNDAALAEMAVHLTTTAKVPHPWEFVHDQIAYNYRMSNINAAVGCAQMEYFSEILKNKRVTAGIYKDFFRKIDIPFMTEPVNSLSNHWLNAIILKDRQQRDQFLAFASSNGIQARPVWKLLNSLPMYSQCQTTNIENARWLENRLVNIPSSTRI
jgi:perosamine synthetase